MKKLEILDILEDLEKEVLEGNKTPEDAINLVTWTMNVWQETCQGIIAVVRASGEAKQLGKLGLSKRRQMLRDLIKQKG
jgi:hypothetical protein